MKTRHLEGEKRPATSKQKPCTATRFPPGGRGKACVKTMPSNKKKPERQAGRTKKPGLCLSARESKPCGLPHRARAGRWPRRLTTKTRGEVAEKQKAGFDRAKTADARAKSREKRVKRERNETRAGPAGSGAGPGDAQKAGQNAKEKEVRILDGQPGRC